MTRLTPQRARCSDAGVEIAAIVDVRASSHAAENARSKGLNVWTDAEVTGVTGARSVREVSMRRRNGGGSNGFSADLLCVSGGLNPSVQLASMTRAPLIWNSGLAAFVPGAPVQAERSAGAARGDLWHCSRGEGRSRRGRGGGDGSWIFRQDQNSPFPRTCRHEPHQSKRSGK